MAGSTTRRMYTGHALNFAGNSNCDTTADPEIARHAWGTATHTAPPDILVIELFSQLM